MLEVKLSQLRARTMAAGDAAHSSEASGGAAAASAAAASSSSAAAAAADSVFDESDLGLATTDGAGMAAVEQRAFSPVPMPLYEEVPGFPSEELIDAEAEARVLRAARREVLKRLQGGGQLALANAGGSVIEALSSAQADSAQGKLPEVEEDEETLEATVASDAAYAWRDKYRPRRPRYMCKLKVGYRWNNYNKTHYDAANPPPRSVLGYAIDVMLPDLIDPSKTPAYSVTKMADEPGFCMLKISPGPPYEDIAFKIIDGKWLYGPKHGFRCQFRGGTFQLHFKFAAERYRR